MPTYVALLRGINVGGRRSVPMATLPALHESLGHGNVTTYIQSGNVVFEATPTDTEGLTTAIEFAIVDEFGFEVPVVLRSREELLAAVEANPYPDRGADLARVAITFSQQAPTLESLHTIDSAVHQPDEFMIDGREIQLHCPSGLGRTNAYERVLRETAGCRRNHPELEDREQARGVDRPIEGRRNCVRCISDKLE